MHFRLVQPRRRLLSERKCSAPGSPIRSGSLPNDGQAGSYRFVRRIGADKRPSRYCPSGSSETRKLGNPARDTIAATSPRRNSRSMPLRRHHPCHNPPDDLRLMLAKRAFQRISSFECTRSRHAHLPSVVCLRADNQNPPLSGAIRKRMFDNRLNLRPRCGHATCVMHLYHHRHGSSIEAVPYRKHQSSASLSSLPSPQPRGPSAVGGRPFRAVYRPETGFAKTSAGSAFDRTTLPPSRLRDRVVESLVRRTTSE